jgi:hypothetical protein
MNSEQAKSIAAVLCRAIDYFKATTDEEKKQAETSLAESLDKIEDEQ